MDLIFWDNFEESRRKLTENTLFTPITRKYTIKRNPKDAVFDNQLHERSKFGDIWWYLQNFDVNKPKYTEKLYTTLVWNITERKRIQLLKVNWRNKCKEVTESGRVDCKNPRKPGSGVAGQRWPSWKGGDTGRWRTVDGKFCSSPSAPTPSHPKIFAKAIFKNSQHFRYHLKIQWPKSPWITLVFYMLMRWESHQATERHRICGKKRSDRHPTFDIDLRCWSFKR